MLRLYEEEEDIFLYLLPDLSSSMGQGDPPKWDHARQIAAALAYIGLSGLDRVAVVPFADGVVDRLPPTRGRGQIFKVFNFLQKAQLGGETRLLDSLRTFVHQSKRRGLAVVISDFYDASGFEDALNYLRYHRFETFVIQVHDRRELEFGHLGDLTLVDCETRATTQVTLNARLVERYRQAHRRFCLRLEEFCTTHQMPYYLAPIQTPFDELVLQVFRDGGLLR
ncbi:MAG: VWA domain-containing protein [Deltaproteobacteria bacterium]|nr:VWA domain-containing protein [Deltaproteobacteria bacterium]